MEGNEVVKYKCNRQKFFDGHENEWHESEEEVDRWELDDDDLPEWLNQYL